MTAPSTVSPRYASASALSFWRIIAEISGGEYSLPPASTRASPPEPETTLYGTIDSSSRTSASLRPMKRLMEKTVFCGLVTAWRLATVPTRRSPLCVNATTDGVVRPPSAFSMTVGSPPSRTAMHEFVVPRSMPMVLAMGLQVSLCYRGCAARAFGSWTREILASFAQILPHRVAAVRPQPPRQVVREGGGSVARLGVQPHTWRELEAAAQRVGEQPAP